MRQFSLKEFLADPSQKVVTKEGHPVRIISTCFKGENGLYPVVGIEDIGMGKEMIRTYTEDGYLLIESSGSMDLFFAPINHTGYINLYRDIDGNIFPGNNIGHRKDVLLLASNKSDYVATAKIEWAE